MGKYEEAIEDFQKAKEVDPKTKNTEDKIDFARKLFEEKNTKEQEANKKSKEEDAEEEEERSKEEEGDNENKS